MFSLTVDLRWFAPNPRLMENCLGYSSYGSDMWINSTQTNKHTDAILSRLGGGRLNLMEMARFHAINPVWCVDCVVITIYNACVALVVSCWIVSSVVWFGVRKLVNSERLVNAARALSVIPRPGRVGLWITGISY